MLFIVIVEIAFLQHLHGKSTIAHRLQAPKGRFCNHCVRSSVSHACEAYAKCPIFTYYNRTRKMVCGMRVCRCDTTYYSRNVRKSLLSMPVDGAQKRTLDTNVTKNRCHMRQCLTRLKAQFLIRRSVVGLPRLVLRLRDVPSHSCR